MTLTVERSIDRPIPEWAEATLLMSSRPDMSASWMFPAIMAARAIDDWSFYEAAIDPDEVGRWVGRGGL